MNVIGKKNMVFGFAYMITTVGLGLFLASKMQANDPNWAESQMHHLLKTAHVHGNLESVLNIIIGFLLCRYGSSTLSLTKVASLLGIVAAVFHSGMLYLGGLGLSAAMNLAPVGALSMLVTLALMAYILFRGVKEE